MNCPADHACCFGKTYRPNQMGNRILRPQTISAPRHLGPSRHGPKQSWSHLKINFWTLPPQVTSAHGHLVPIALVTSSPLWQILIISILCTVFAHFNIFTVCKVNTNGTNQVSWNVELSARLILQISVINTFERVFCMSYVILSMNNQTCVEICYSFTIILLLLLFLYV